MKNKHALIASTALASLTMGMLPGLLPAAAQDASENEMEEVLVVGSFIRRPSQTNSPSPIDVIGSERLDEIGAIGLSDLTQTLTINTGSQNNPDAFTQNATTGTGNYNLRGLGVSSTLVLLNKRRQVTTGVTTNDGVSFVDINSLVPQIAIERIDILKDGAAALYGTDAVAGVVNHITRDTFDGLEIQGQYQTHSLAAEGNYADYQLEVLGGLQFDRGGIIAAVSYLDRTALTTAERRLSTPSTLTTPGNDESVLGNPGAFFLGSGGPFAAAAPIPLPDGSTATPVFSVPAGTPIIDPTGCAEVGGFPRPATPDGIVSTPLGDIGFCGFDFGEFFNLVPEETRLQGFARGHYDLTESVQLFTEIGFARNRAERNNSPTFPFLTLDFANVFPGTPGNPFNEVTVVSGGTLIPADDPTNPLAAVVPGVDVVIGGTPVQGVPTAFFGRVSGTGGDPAPNNFAYDTFRFVGGFTWELPGNWYVDAAFTRAQNDSVVKTPDIVSLNFQQALVGLGGIDCDPLTDAPGSPGCEFFFPFSTALTGETPNSPEVVDFVTATQRLDANSTLSVIDLVAAGDLFQIGEQRSVGLAVGFQFRDEQFSQEFDSVSNSDGFGFVIGNPDFQDQRDIFAGFAEVQIPLLDILDIQAAVRFEDFGGEIGDTVDPKVAINFRPFDFLSFRGSWGTSFRAPSIFQSSGTLTTLEQVVDPLLGNAVAFVANRTTASDNPITPEQSEAFNVGATLTPIEGLVFNFDYWNFDFEDVIIREDVQATIFADPDNPDVVIRGPAPEGATGPIIQVNTDFANASEVETSGFDFDLTYVLDTDFGTFRPRVNGTYILNYDLVDPLAGPVDGEGNRNFTNFGDPTPRLRLNTALGYTLGPVSANVIARYIDGFTDDQNMGVEIGGQWRVDLQASLNLGFAVDALADTSLGLGIINVADKEPPFVATNGGFESRVHDPRGRLLYVRLQTRF